MRSLLLDIRLSYNDSDSSISLKQYLNGTTVNYKDKKKVALRRLASLLGNEGYPLCYNYLLTWS